MMITHKIHNDYDWTADCQPIVAGMSELMPYARDSSALAFLLTRTKLSLPYSVEVACNLEQFSLAARREARREICKRASAPQQP